MEIKALELHAQALKFRAARNQVLSANIANADTPNYKARDFNIDFGDALTGGRTRSISLTQTNELHRDAFGTARVGGELMYRVPTQATLDGNSVESDVEQAAFAENALHYRASLAFLDGQIRSLRYAINGGD